MVFTRQTGEFNSFETHEVVQPILERFGSEKSPALRLTESLWVKTGLPFA